MARLVSYASSVTTLYPGDVITTGTPAGVGPLIAGDTIRLELSGLGLDLVVLILDDSAYGMIRWKQAADGFPDFGLTFGNPDFVKYAEAYGARGWRVTATDDLVPTLEQAVTAKARPTITKNDQNGFTVVSLLEWRRRGAAAVSLRLPWAEVPLRRR